MDAKSLKVEAFNVAQVCHKKKKKEMAKQRKLSSFT